MAVSLSLASVQGSIPIAYQLYLPKDWAGDAERRKAAGVPENIVFATKPEIALEQMRQTIAASVPMGVVLADAGYGDETAFGMASLKWACSTRSAFDQPQRYGHRGLHRYRPNPGPVMAYAQRDYVRNTAMNRWR